MRNSLSGPVLAIGLLACSHNNKPQTVTQAPAVESSSGQQCALKQSAGTNIVTADTNDGVALVFTTTGDVADLRAQIHQLADMHNSSAGMQPGQNLNPPTVAPSAPGASGTDPDTKANSGVTAGAGVHGSVKNTDESKGAKAGADVHAGVGDHTATAGADVHGGVKNDDGTHTATAGADIHAGVKSNDRTNSATAAGDIHGTARSGTGGAIAGADLHGNTTDMSSTNMSMIPSHAKTEDIPGGERLVLVPEDPSQLPALRAQAREQVSMLEKGECPTMMMPPQMQPTGDHPGQHPTGT